MTKTVLWFFFSLPFIAAGFLWEHACIGFRTGRLMYCARFQDIGTRPKP